jgi:hypothetical protein
MITILTGLTLGAALAVDGAAPRNTLRLCTFDGSHRGGTSSATWRTDTHFIRMRDYGETWDVTRVETFERWALAEHSDLTLEEAAERVGVTPDDLHAALAEVAT